MQSMKKIYEQIYAVAAGIPVGAVMTYGQIARSVGNPGWSRLVARAIANTPEELDIPCHRIVNSKGEMAPDYVFGGQHIQRRMLEDEGVAFKPNGCVDFKKSGL